MPQGLGLRTPAPPSPHLTPRASAICQHVEWVVEGTSAPEDLLAWVRVLQRDQATILDNQGCGQLVDEIRAVLELRMCGAIGAAHCLENLQRLLQQARRTRWFLER